VTPAYNGAESVAACLESVRNQTYRNWIHIVVDNASTDGTRQIAESFAAQDPRVMVLSFTELLPMLQNFNRALSVVPPSAHYLKQLHVDDVLHANCLMAMVQAAQRHPSAAVVVSRFYIGSVLSPPDAPRKATLLHGRDVARETLIGATNLLGTPSVPLLRVDRLVGWPALFRIDTFPPGHPRRPPHNQGDKEALLSTLGQGDVVFLPETLVSLRDEGPSATGFARRVGGWHPGRLDMLLRRGSEFMDDLALRRGIRRTAWKWIRSLTWRSVGRFGHGDPDFYFFQTLCLNELLPRLRDAGFTREAAMLAGFKAGFARALPADSTEGAA
jgi:glycosyltransferase involved in cell wall biosynthesis